MGPGPLLLLLLSSSVSLVCSAPVTEFVRRNGSQLVLNGEAWRYAGANMYWLGVDENCEPPKVGECVHYPSQYRLEDAMVTAAALGFSVVRAHTLGISSGMASQGLALNPSKGVFNDKAFATIDYAIAQAKANGIRLIVPLTDDYSYYHGSYHDYLKFAGYNCTDPAVPSPSSDCIRFYSDPAVIAGFKAYLHHLLNHVNQYTKVALKDEPAILAWETGNELHEGSGVPFTNWTQAIAGYLRSELGAKQLILDGRAGMSPAAVHGNPDVDMLSDHFYGGWSSAIAATKIDSVAVNSGNKVFIVGEYGAATSTSAEIAPFLRVLENTTGVSGDTWWSFFGHGDNYGFVPHGDKFTLHFPGQGQQHAQLVLALRQHAYAMRGVSPPQRWPTPGAPLVTGVVINGNGTTTLTWRGATLAVNYTVQHGPSASGPWVTDCDKSVSDYDTPLLLTSPKGDSVFFRVQGVNLDGEAGPWSPPRKSSASAPSWWQGL